MDIEQRPCPDAHMTVDDWKAYILTDEMSIKAGNYGNDYLSNLSENFFYRRFLRCPTKNESGMSGVRDN